MKRIAIIDDETAICSTLKDLILLEEPSWDISLFSSGQSFFDFLKKNDIDVVVSDMNMPDVDGSVILDRVNQEKPNVKLIAMSGYPEMLNDLLKKIPSVYRLDKPFDHVKLIKEIKGD